MRKEGEGYRSKTSLDTIVGFVGDPWDSAVPVIRLVSPAACAGVTLIRGNEGAEIDPDSVALGDLVIIQRDFPRHATACAEILARARALGKPVVYDLDDLLFALPEEHSDRASHHYAAALIPMLRMVLEVDAVTVSTAPLSGYLSIFRSPVWIQPNYLDDALWASPSSTRSDTAPTRIGYMGGQTHARDLESVVSVLRKVVRRYGGQVELAFYGCEPPASLLELQQVKWIPLQTPNYYEFVTFFVAQQADIFIAPLVGSSFNQSKSAIKFLEYSALGVPGVYSRVAPYEAVITDGEDGFLCRGDEAWLEALTRLIEDPLLRRTMGDRARETLHEQWVLSRRAVDWCIVYEEILQQGSVPHAAASELALVDLTSRFQHELDSIENARLEAQIEALIRERQHTMDALQSTWSWKLLEVLWRIERWIVPPGSRRERWLRGARSPSE